LISSFRSFFTGAGTPLFRGCRCGCRCFISLEEVTCDTVRAKAYCPGTVLEAGRETAKTLNNYC